MKKKKQQCESYTSCIDAFSHSRCWINDFKDCPVMYISVLYEYIYFFMHVQVDYYEHLQCCSFN